MAAENEFGARERRIGNGFDSLGLPVELYGYCMRRLRRRLGCGAEVMMRALYSIRAGAG